jgi:hypothetical protein
METGRRLSPGRRGMPTTPIQTQEILMRESTSVNRRTLLAGLAGATLAPVLAAFGAQTGRREVEIPLLMTPVNSGVYNAYAVIQSRAQDHHDWLRPVVFETGGFNYNVSYMARSADKWNNSMFGSATVLEWAAEAGVKPFYDEPQEVVSDFRIIGGMGPTSNFWLTFDPAIRTPHDFAGRSVATGLLTQNEWGMYQRMLLDGWGITDKLDSLNPLSPDANIQALIDGRVEVATMVSFFAPGVEEISIAAPFKSLQAANRPFHYVHVPSSMIEEYNRKNGANFQIRDWEANRYPDQPEPFTTFGDDMSVSVHKSFPEELAYEFTRLWVDMAPVVAKYNSLGRIWTPEVLAGPAQRTPERMHPGAMKAFRELGLVA